MFNYNEIKFNKKYRSSIKCTKLLNHAKTSFTNVDGI